MTERQISYSLSQTDTCSSVYFDLWVTIMAVKKVSDGTEGALKNDCEFFHCLNTIHVNSCSDNKPTVFLIVFFFLLKAVVFPAFIAQHALIVYVDGCKLIQDHIFKASLRLPIH